MPLNDTKLRRIDGKPYDGPDELPDGGTFLEPDAR